MLGIVATVFVTRRLVRNFTHSLMANKLLQFPLQNLLVTMRLVIYVSFRLYALCIVFDASVSLSVRVYMKF